MPDQTKRLIVIVLDRSGSMHAVKRDAEGGLRAFLEAQHEAPGETLVTLRQFDTRHDTVFENTPLDQVPPFTLNPRGGTALLDAVGSTIGAVTDQLEALPEADRPGEVILVIQTDGHENSSKEWTADRVRDAIEDRQAAGWQVFFLGADQDAFTVAAGMGIGHSSTLSYSGLNTRDAMTSAGSAVARGSQTGNYAFTDDERTASGEVGP